MNKLKNSSIQIQISESIGYFRNEMKRNKTKHEINNKVN